MWQSFLRIAFRWVPVATSVPLYKTGEPARTRTDRIMANTSENSLGDVKFLTVAEVASVMRVSKMTVYRLVHNGDLPAVRVGRSFRVPEQAVHDYLRDSYIETA